MRCISGCLPPRAGSCGDEEDFRVYRKDEAYSAAGLPLSRDLESTLDGGGGDTHPVGECAITDLDCHPYLSRCPFSFGSPLRSPERTTFTRSFYQVTYRQAGWSCILRKVDQGVEISVNNRCGGCATPPTLLHYAAVHRKIRAKSFVAPGLLVPSWSRFAHRRGGAALTPRLQAGR